MDLREYLVIQGQFVTLKSIEENDAIDIYKWRTSSSATHLNQPKEYSIDTQKKWITTRPATELNYIIYSNERDEKVGMIAIVDIDEQNQKAEVGRLLLDEIYLNKSNPYGLEAMKLTYNLILNNWKFNKIYGTILSSNVGMINLQKFLGMQEEGVLKKHLFLQNQFLDLHLFSIFTEGFNAKYLSKINFLLKAF